MFGFILCKIGMRGSLACGSFGGATVGTTSTKMPLQDEQDTRVSAEDPAEQEEKIGMPHQGAEKSVTSMQAALIMTPLLISFFLAALDLTIISTALPSIAEYFQVSDAYAWIGASFALANSASGPIWGKMSSIWGRKPLLLISIAVFFIGSLLSGIAVNTSMLLGGRAVQGLGAGGLITLTSIVISDMFSMADRPFYYGLMGGVWACAGAIGPVVGGVLTQNLSWRYCFYINLPITAAVFIVTAFVLKLRNPKTPMLAGFKAVDWYGSFSIIGSTVMFLLGLHFGGITYPWTSATVICLIISGLFLFCLFLIHEWRFAASPIMPLRLLHSKSNIACLIGNFFHNMIFVSYAFFIPLYLQGTLGAGALLSGACVLPLAMAISFSSVATGLYVKATGHYLRTIFIGAFGTILGCGLFIDFPPDRAWAKVIIYQIVAGIALGPCFQSLLIGLQNNVPPQDVAMATTMFSFTRSMAHGIGLVVCGVIFQNGMRRQAGTLHVALGPEVASLLSGGNAAANVFFVDTLPDAQKAVARTAFLVATRDIWIATTAFAGAILLCAFAIRAKVLSKEHDIVKTGLSTETKFDAEAEAKIPEAEVPEQFTERDTDGVQRHDTNGD